MPKVKVPQDGEDEEGDLDSKLQKQIQRDRKLQGRKKENGHGDLEEEEVDISLEAFALAQGIDIESLRAALELVGSQPTAAVEAAEEQASEPVPEPTTEAEAPEVEEEQIAPPTEVLPAVAEEETVLVEPEPTPEVVETEEERSLALTGIYFDKLPEEEGEVRPHPTIPGAWTGSGPDSKSSFPFSSQDAAEFGRRIYRTGDRTERLLDEIKADVKSLDLRLDTVHTSQLILVQSVKALTEAISTLVGAEVVTGQRSPVREERPIPRGTQPSVRRPALEKREPTVSATNPEEERQARLLAAVRGLQEGVR